MLRPVRRERVPLWRTERSIQTTDPIQPLSTDFPTLRELTDNIAVDFAIETCSRTALPSVEFLLRPLSNHASRLVLENQTFPGVYRCSAFATDHRFISRRAGARDPWITTPNESGRFACEPYGIRNSDARYPRRVEEIYFTAFVEPLPAEGYRTRQRVKG